MTLEMIYEEMGDEEKRFQVSGQALLCLAGYSGAIVACEGVPCRVW